MGIIFTDTHELYGTSDVKSLIFPISYHDLCAISDISNIKNPTKEHLTSKERQHELVMMSFDVCKNLTPICLFLPTKLKCRDIIFFIFFKVLRSSLLALL